MKSTPRTDNCPTDKHGYVPKEFARTLEFENVRLRSALDRALTAINAGFGKAQRDHIIDEGRRALVS